MKTLYVKNGAAWRSWLEKNDSLSAEKQAKEIWLIYYKKGSGKPRISYEDAVLEALCFGWIDGKVGTLDDKRYVQRFTPRKPHSRWSELNISRTRKLIAEGKMTASGLAVFRPERKTETLPTELPDELLSKLKRNQAAWKSFQAYPPYYRRMSIGWVASAKKEETKLKRLQQLIEFSSRNERIKFI